ncbi:MAG: hypothetical protein M3Y08_04275, partial [Fibrobacterota bacterium]|nr:hypothetical protein [Fibrobacterota bacterium]
MTVEVIQEKDSTLVRTGASVSLALWNFSRGFRVHGNACRAGNRRFFMQLSALAKLLFHPQGEHPAGGAG